MVRQLVARLWAAECSGTGRFSVCVTGDHSTPVVFGDHSHEPVPLAIAHVRCLNPQSVEPYTRKSPKSYTLNPMPLTGTSWMLWAGQRPYWQRH